QRICQYPFNLMQCAQIPKSHPQIAGIGHASYARSRPHQDDNYDGRFVRSQSSTGSRAASSAALPSPTTSDSALTARLRRGRGGEPLGGRFLFGGSEGRGGGAPGGGGGGYGCAGPPARAVGKEEGAGA